MLVNGFMKILKGELLNWKLIDLLPTWGMLLIAGATGSGKTTLAYAILEYLHYDQPNRDIYVYGFPKEKVGLLPEWINPLDTLEFPEGSIVLVDEAYIQFHSRSSMSQKSKFMDMFAGLVRQKDILGIFISQTLRKIDIGILSSSQLILVKKVSSFQVRMDRSEMRAFLSDVLQSFKDAEEKGNDQQHCVYAISNEKDFEGLILNSNSEPSFWSTGLSKAWAGVKLSDKDL